MLLRLTSFAVVLLLCLPGIDSAKAQTAVERNTNAQGVTPTGEYRGIPGMQDNEPSCAINPLLARNIVCAWNASGGSDGPIGDTWIKVSESSDSGESFLNRFMNGSPLDPATSVGQAFAADPITMCWPGGCGVVALASTRAPGGGAGGGIYMQLMPDMNRESGFRHALATTLDPVYLSDPTLFADKPFALYMLDETNPGTVPVSVTVNRPGGGTEVVTRAWPKARILVSFALGDPVGDEIKILSMYSDNYGNSWSTPIELSTRPYWDRHSNTRGGGHNGKSNGKGHDTEPLPAPLNQGVSISAIGNTVVYAYRVFADDDNPPAIRGAISGDRGQTIGEPFEIVPSFCPYDVPTLPNEGNTNTAAARTNAFPWLSNNGNKFVLLYAERRPSSDGGCFTAFDAPTDSRIKAIVGSATGDAWSPPVEIAPNPDHGFQFQPVVDCALGTCQAAWWDSRFDSQRVTSYLQDTSTSPLRAEALAAFRNLPVLGDFNYATGPNSVIQFRRTARLLGTKLDIDSGTAIATDTPPAVISQYRQALIDNSVREIERDGWNIKAYKTSTVPFMGDYSWLTSAKLRLAFDPSLPNVDPVWENNASVDLANPGRDPQFWISFVTSRNVRGDIYTARISDPLPYTRTPDGVSANLTYPDERENDPASEGDETLRANAVEDFNDGAGFCTPTGNPGLGVIFDAPNNRTKDFDIYGALIENQVSAFSLNPTKTLNIQRSYTIVAENESDDLKSFRLVIANQPSGFPADARASWAQLPFDPSDPDFATTPPTTVTTLQVGPRSSESLAAFLVSTATVNPVAIDIFEQLDGGAERLVNTVTINGVAEDGEFLNADGTVNNFEIHNPQVYFPDEFNPDEFNPDEYNPDEFNPDMYTPDEFNPDEFNPDEFNPDEFNPDEFNPDEFNPDEFNPDEFNPDEFNPDEFNAPLIDPGNLDNPEIPDPDLGTITGLVSKLDINYGIQNVGNTTTPYTVDFEVVDEEVLARLASGELVTQLIAWQDKKIDDVQFCEPREISENRIIAAVNNPDLSVLRIPDIDNNRLGALTFTIAPDDVVQLTLRFIAPRELLVQLAPKLSSTKISSVFASQVANTGSRVLFLNEELILDDRTPPEFNFVTGDTTTFEATGPLGALIPTSLVTATQGTDPVPVTCDPTLPAQVGLDIWNSPAGPTGLTCIATTSNGVTNELQLSVSVLDRAPPVITLSGPTSITIEAGTTYVDPGASVVDTVDTAPVLTIDSSGVDTAAVGTYTVYLDATDESGNPAQQLTRTVIVEDTTGPEIGDFDPPTFEPPLVDRFVLGDDESSFQLYWGPFEVTDASSIPSVGCDVGILDSARSDPANGIFTFVHDFPVGRTNVTCIATDGQGNSTSASFSVDIFDETAPVLTLLGDQEITIDVGDTYVDPGATATDNVNSDDDITIDIDAGEVDTNKAGTYTVVISATDLSGNTSQATRTVIVKGYPGGTGIVPKKLNPRLGSSNVLEWAWLDENGNAADSSGDRQIMRIRQDNCITGTVVFEMAGDPGTSGFRYKVDNYWQFNWQTEGQPGSRYCAVVESSLTGQTQVSPIMTLK